MQPTFRGNNANNAHFPFDKLDLTAWGKFLDETDSVLIVKLHPFVKRRIEIPDEYAHRILDASDYREVNDILFIVDVLITDYSSIIYEMSLLKKPCFSLLSTKSIMKQQEISMSRMRSLFLVRSSTILMSL